MVIAPENGIDLSEFATAYGGAQRLRGGQRTPHANVPEIPPLPRPHVPHNRRRIAIALAAAMVATAVTGAIQKKSTEDTSTAIENIGPGGVIIERKNFPIGEPLNIYFDSDDGPVVRLETRDKPQIWTWRADSTPDVLDYSRQYKAVLGPEYTSEIPNGLGKVVIVMGEPENNPDIVFGGVWLVRVNSEGIPVGADGQVLSPGETPLYTKADSIRIIHGQVPQEPMLT